MESWQDATGSTRRSCGSGAAGRRVPPGSRLGVGGDGVGRAEAEHRHDRDGAQMGSSGRDRRRRPAWGDARTPQSAWSRRRTQPPRRSPRQAPPARRGLTTTAGHGVSAGRWAEAWAGLVAWRQPFAQLAHRSTGPGPRANPLRRTSRTHRGDGPTHSVLNTSQARAVSLADPQTGTPRLRSLGSRSVFRMGRPVRIPATGDNNRRRSGVHVIAAHG